MINPYNFIEKITAILIILLSILLSIAVASADEFLNELLPSIKKEGEVFILLKEICIQTPYHDERGSKLPYILPKGTEITIGGE